MRCDDIGDTLFLYVADALDAEEAARVEAQIIACDDCKADLLEARETWAAVGIAVEPQAAPPRVKDRLFAAINDASDAEADPNNGASACGTGVEALPSPKEPQPVAGRIRASCWRYTVAAAAGLALGILGTFIYFNQKLSELNQLEARIAQLNKEQPGDTSVLASQLLGWIGSPAVQVVSLQSPADESKSWGRLMWNAEENVAQFFGSQIPKDRANGPFRVWLVTESGKRVPAGQFNLDSDRSVRFELAPPKSNATFTQIKIMPARKGNATQEKTTPLLAGAWPDR